MRARHGNVLKPPSDFNFDYYIMLPNSLKLRTSSDSSTLITISLLSFYASSVCGCHFVYFGIAISLQTSRIQRKQRACAASVDGLLH